MAALFSKPKVAAPATPPTIDMAQENVSGLRHARKLKARAANMLSDGAAAPTAKRVVTGN